MVHRAALAFSLLFASTAVAAGENPPPPAQAELRTAVARDLAAIDAALRRAADIGDDAREEKDLAKLVCVDEKLHAMRQLAGVAKEANAELLSSLAGEDVAATNAHATKIAIARSRVEALGGEAGRCLGALLYRTGETTTVEVREPSGLPGAGSPPSRLGVVHRLERPEDRSPMVNPDAARDRPATER